MKKNKNESEKIYNCYCFSFSSWKFERELNLSEIHMHLNHSVQKAKIYWVQWDLNKQRKFIKSNLKDLNQK